MTTKFWLNYGQINSEPNTFFDMKIRNEQLPAHCTILRTMTQFHFRASIGELAIPAQQYPLILGAQFKPFDVDGDDGWSHLQDGNAQQYLFWNTSHFEINGEKNGAVSSDQHYFGPVDHHYEDVATRRITPEPPWSLFFSAATFAADAIGSGDMWQPEFSGWCNTRILFEAPD